MIDKACPVVIRENKGFSEILAFKHPLAGSQLVKGTIEVGESQEEACERELFEESGLIGKAVKNLGTWDSGFEGQVWRFCIMKLEESPQDSWTYHCADDNGHDFKFFWQRLDVELDNDWHPLFKNTLAFIQKAL
jgi:8-oxo-dGTP pyrophosphatase MutT (NUDIX family)